MCHVMRYQSLFRLMHASQVACCTISIFRPRVLRPDPRPFSRRPLSVVWYRAETHTTSRRRV
jgi:hypothetical protein